MAAAVSDVLLFVSSTSKASGPCVQFVTRHRIPVKIVRLDTEADRKRAANGSFFQITVVPSMVVIFEDGNTQVFVGVQKITQWLTAMMKSASAPPIGGGDEEEGPLDLSRPDALNAHNPAGGNMYGPRPNPPRRGPPPPHRRVVGDDDDLAEAAEQGYPPPRRVVEFEDDYEPDPRERPPPKPKSKAKAKSILRKTSKARVKPGGATPKSKARRRRAPVAEEIEGPDDEDPVDQRAVANQKLAVVRGRPERPSRMKGIFDLAKQMEQQRLDSLPYREEDLPRF